MKKQVHKKMKLAGAERRQLILDAAMKMFSRNGFRGTTVRQLARQAGISEAMIYHHFPSKEALYDAMLEMRIEENRNILFPIDAAGAKKDRAVLEAIIGNYLRRQLSDSSFVRMLLFSALEGHELARKFVREPMQDFFGFLGSYLDERANEGDLRPLNGPVTARLIMGMAFYFVLLCEIFKDPGSQGLSVEAITKDAVDLICRGITISGCGE